MSIIKKSNRGITLVALVVTIIVLLILATVSINLVLGENGIITRAKGAKNLSEKSRNKEFSEINNLENEIYNSTGEVKQVNDLNPGEFTGEGTKEKPYLVESIEDLVAMAKNVNEGNSYEGK